MRQLSCVLLIWSLSLHALAQDAAPVGGAPLRAVEAGDEAPHLAFASESDPNPGSGWTLRLLGWIGSGIGLAGVAQAPLCHMEDVTEPGDKRRCRNSSIAMGSIGLGLGVPLLIFGYRKRRAQRAWKQRHALSELVTPLLHVERDRFLIGVRF
jgi:hypothetical protein